jgi:putative membrane protein
MEFVMSVVFAFLHHLAAFTLVAALAVELVLMRGELTQKSAHQLQRADLVFGLSALSILMIGFLRLARFEKGMAYYFHSGPFMAKMTLFVLIGLLSIYPTLQFLGWSEALKQGQAPAPTPRQTSRIRTLIQAELTLLALLILCAVMMAKGVGYVG